MDFRNNPKFFWPLGDNIDSTVSATTNCPYDRFVLLGNDLVAKYPSDSAVGASVFYFESDFFPNLTNAEALLVSDHYPIDLRLKFGDALSPNAAFPTSGVCGDKLCTTGETAASCPADCNCGNGQCEFEEMATSTAPTTCAADCPLPLSHNTVFSLNFTLDNGATASRVGDAGIVIAGHAMGPTMVSPAVSLGPSGPNVPNALVAMLNPAGDNAVWSAWIEDVSSTTSRTPSVTATSKGEGKVRQKLLSSFSSSWSLSFPCT